LAIVDTFPPARSTVSIRTGEVVAVDDGTATVRTRPLVWAGDGLAAGPPCDEAVRWSVDGMALIGPPAPGQTVAVHWDWVCDVLSERAARNGIGLVPSA
jgi:hypothetical protein